MDPITLIKPALASEAGPCGPKVKRRLSSKTDAEVLLGAQAVAPGASTVAVV